MLKKLFGFDSSRSSIRIELLSGLTTFLTMAYVLAVNPDILAHSGMDKGAIFTATALSSAIATIIIAIYAKMPLAQAPAMGVNAFFAYTLVGAMGYSWQTALTITFIEGIIFILLTVFNVREKILESIPLSLRSAIPVGIGLFIAFIGLKNAGLVVDNEATLVALGEINGSTSIALLGILISGVLLYRRVKGALFYGIIITTLISILCGIVTIPEGFSIVAAPASIEPTLFKFEFSSLLSLDVIVITLLLVFMDMFNTIGTLVGAIGQVGMIGKDGSIPKAKEMMLSDAIGTTVGAALGTSTVTTYSESMTGIAEGGRTGITALSTGLLFILALFFSPLFLLIPSIATAGTLVLVGVMMITSIKDIDFKDYSEGVPSFLTILLMVLTYSIAEGIVFGIIFYTAMKLFTGQRRELNYFHYAISLLLIVRYIYLGSGF